MHEDRDNYIILITLLPIVLFVGLYVTWRSAGEPSFSGPTLPLPFIPLPAIPDLERYLPAPLLSWIRNIQRNGDSIIPAVGLGILMGLVATGTLIDAVKKFWAWMMPPPGGSDRLHTDESQAGEGL